MLNHKDLYPAWPNSSSSRFVYISLYFLFAGWPTPLFSWLLVHSLHTCLWVSIFRFCRLPVGLLHAVFLPYVLLVLVPMMLFKWGSWLLFSKSFIFYSIVADFPSASQYWLISKFPIFMFSTQSFCHPSSFVDFIRGYCVT